MSAATREAGVILDRLERLKRSVSDCHPQVPSLSVDAALVIERYSWAGNLDKFFTDQSFEDLDKLTKQFEDNCSCQSTGQFYAKRVIEEQ